MKSADYLNLISGPFLFSRESNRGEKRLYIFYGSFKKVSDSISFRKKKATVTLQRSWIAVCVTIVIPRPCLNSSPHSTMIIQNRHHDLEFLLVFYREIRLGRYLLKGLIHPRFYVDGFLLMSKFSPKISYPVIFYD